MRRQPVLLTVATCCRLHTTYRSQELLVHTTRDQPTIFCSKDVRIVLYHLLNISFNPTSSCGTAPIQQSQGGLHLTRTTYTPGVNAQALGPGIRQSHQFTSRHRYPGSLRTTTDCDMLYLIFGAEPVSVRVFRNNCCVPCVRISAKLNNSCRNPSIAIPTS